MGTGGEPQANYSGIGEGLTRYLAEYFQGRSRRQFMDISVLHDNRSAIALYEKLGFKTSISLPSNDANAINEPLFIEPSSGADEANPLCQKLSLMRLGGAGILVDIIDAGEWLFSTQGFRA